MHPSRRQTLALVLLALSGIALASGGVFSPLLFFAAGVVLLGWPALLERLLFDDLVPERNSILLRSKYLPFFWCALAELKPGAEEFPRAVSSFAGILLVFTDTGRTYLLAEAIALGQRGAEVKILDALRLAAPSGHGGAYLLPLDAEEAGEVLSANLVRSKLPLVRLEEVASRVSGVLVLDCSSGTVRRAAALEIEGRRSGPTFPRTPRKLESAPLTWEVLESVGRRTRWPQPDPFSNLLDSMLATRGVPLGERVRELATSGDHVTVRSLSGDEVHTTRPQLRAIFSVYS